MLKLGWFHISPLAVNSKEGKRTLSDWKWHRLSLAQAGEFRLPPKHHLWFELLFQRIFEIKRWIFQEKYRYLLSFSMRSHRNSFYAISSFQSFVVSKIYRYVQIILQVFPNFVKKTKKKPVLQFRSKICKLFLHSRAYPPTPSIQTPRLRYLASPLHAT